MKLHANVGALAAMALAAPILGLVLTAPPAGAAAPLTPVVTGVSPSAGHTVTSSTASATTPGGTALTINGVNFTGATAVDFGGVPATGTHVVSDTTITATSPTITNTIGNTVDVTVTTALGTSATGVDDEFTYPYNYTSAGTLTESSITLATSAQTIPVNGTVMLTASAPTDVGTSDDFGLSIVDVTDAAAPVAVAHIPAGVTVSTSVSEAAAQTNRYVAAYDACTVYPSPCPPGALETPLANDGGVSTPVNVTWNASAAPAVNSVSPVSGPIAGGTVVTITGTNLTGATAVSFGGVAATGVQVVSATSVTATSPAGSAGIVNVTVTTAEETSPTSTADEFTYTASPAPSPPTPPTTTPAPATCSQPDGAFLYGSAVVGIADTSDDRGYWIVNNVGEIAACGDAVFLGQVAASTHPIVGIAATPDGDGYYVVASDGGVFTFGDAAFQGSTGALRLNTPIVGMAVDSATGGYWLVASDGGVFTFNAPFYGSTGNIVLNKPVVGMAAANGGSGYWIVASDGGIFSFNAPFWGSTGAIHLNKPVVGIATNTATGGYWLVASDGGIFSFNAPFYGSTGNIILNKPIEGMEASPSGSGYRFVAADGGVFDFGTSGFFGTPVFAAPPPPPPPTTPSPSPSPSPAPSGASCTVSLSNGSPADYTDEIASISSNVPNASVTLAKAYKTTTSYDSGDTNASGAASIEFDISGASVGYKVVVTVSVGAATCRTSFIPS